MHFSTSFASTHRSRSEVVAVRVRSVQTGLARLCRIAHLAVEQVPVQRPALPTELKPRRRQRKLSCPGAIASHELSGGIALIQPTGLVWLVVMPHAGVT